MKELMTDRLILRSFTESDYEDLFEFGYIVNKNYRQKGYACEALRAVIGEAFREETHRVYAECDPRNTASWKLLEKAGLGREAHLHQNVFFIRMKPDALYGKIPMYTPYWKKRKYEFTGGKWKGMSRRFF